jgi:hypothetical protein
LEVADDGSNISYNILCFFFINYCILLGQTYFIVNVFVGVFKSVKRSKIFLVINGNGVMKLGCGVTPGRDERSGRDNRVGCHDFKTS